MKKDIHYQFMLFYGPHSGTWISNNGTPEDADICYAQLVAARDWVRQHPDTPPPRGSLREGVYLGATFAYRNRTGNDQKYRYIKIAPPAPEDQENTTDDNAPEWQIERTEQEKHDKPKTQPTTDHERRFRRIFAEIARLKQAVEDLQMQK